MRKAQVVQKVVEEGSLVLRAISPVLVEAMMGQMDVVTLEQADEDRIKVEKKIRTALFAKSKSRQQLERDLAEIREVGRKYGMVVH